MNAVITNELARIGSAPIWIGDLHASRPAHDVSEGSS